ncbi:DUF3995 domain-containing protein [Embleya sp. MST-111070]|uniref:DUF3995 domain-containing protein n=1 Tax=Embleya sp. MST-111070 TaxID=3398231 RepID=UPI003F73AB9A
MLKEIGKWPGFAAAAWGFLFAIPSFYWVLGGTAGTGSTIAPSLLKLLEDRDTGFIVILWATGVLKVVGGLLGLALTRPWRPGTRLVLLWAGWGAGVLLILHGLLFIVHGALVQAGTIRLAADLVPVSRWYTYLWGPWFLAGGLAFAAASYLNLRRWPHNRPEVLASAAGGTGALLLSAALYAAGIG